MRWFFRALEAIAALAFIVVAASLAYLAYPGKPAPSRYLSFDGFVILPSHGLLNVLDYLTLSGRTLFVTGTSSGSVFAIALDQDGSPLKQPVLERTGEPRVHGVAVVAMRALQRS